MEAAVVAADGNALWRAKTYLKYFREVFKTWGFDWQEPVLEHHECSSGEETWEESRLLWKQEEAPHKYLRLTFYSGFLKPNAIFACSDEIRGILGKGTAMSEFYTIFYWFVH